MGREGRIRLSVVSLRVFWEQAMRFRKILALRGPNYWANFPVLEA